MLLIDSGNTSFKCRFIAADGVSERVFDNQRAADQVAFGDYLQGLPVTNIYLASVASLVVRQRIQDSIQQHTSAQLHILETQPELGGVRNGYLDYRQLGVDRWLALLGAHAISHHDAIIIDAGSAITIDLLSQRQGHLGGAILPGFRCDPRRFEQLFPAIDFSELDNTDAPPGCSTRQCLRPQQTPASSQRIANIIERWRRYLQTPLEILLCGQDARLAAQALPQPFRIEPDLVFTGMLKQIECLG